MDLLCSVVEDAVEALGGEVEPQRLLHAAHAPRLHQPASPRGPGGSRRGQMAPWPARESGEAGAGLEVYKYTL